jgi:cell division septation protein DedD
MKTWVRRTLAGTVALVAIVAVVLVGAAQFGDRKHRRIEFA